MSACLFLLVGSGLLLQTLRNLYSIDVGFNTQHVLLFRIDPEANGYLGNRFTAVNEQIVERLEAIPGVKSVSLSSKALLNGGRNRSGIEIAGRNAEPGHPESVSRMTVRHSFFETMQIPIVKGRALAAGDNQNAPDVAVINEAFAKKFFPNAEPIGNRFGFGFRNRSEIEIVGVVRDAKNSQIRETVEPAIYLSYLQNPTDGPVTDPPTYELRTLGDPLSAVGAVRNAIREVDRNLPLIDVRTQSDEVDKRLSQERLLAFSSTAFGGLTLILASTGLFGLMSYSVARRRNEIGIRMAVGARRSDMIMMVMRETLTLAGIGTLLGLIGIVALSRLLETMVFGLAPTDPTIITGATILMLAVAVAAGYLPARRASRVDPMIALRHE